jgi:DNA polymerase
MRLITIDFETYYSREFSLSKMTTEAYIRDPLFEVIGFAYKIEDKEPMWVTGTYEHMLTVLAGLDLEDSYVLAHNMAFDGAILAWHFGIRPKYYLDTLSMARPITGGTVGGSLAKLAQKFALGEKGTEVVNALGKTIWDFSPAELAAYGEYCKNDVQICWNLYYILKQWNPPKEMFIQDLMLRMFIDPVLELNEVELNLHLTSVQEKKHILMTRLDASIGRDALMSNPKFAQVLVKLGVEPPMKVSLRTEKETFAFGKTDPEFKALLEHPDPRVQAVVSARFGIKSTLEETRTESFIGIAKRGKLPILLNYWGAHTGRASGGDKMNLQNLPRAGALRRAIKAPNGHKIVACDSSQIEARVVAMLANERKLLKAFSQGEDIYSQFASDVYGRTITKENKVERFVGKTCILGLGYGMGHEKFRATLKQGMGGMALDISEDEAKRIVRLYRDKFNQIADLWKHADKCLESMSRGYTDSFRTLMCNADGVYLPNNTMIRYANLRKEADQHVYDGRYGPVKIYGGKFVENVTQALAKIVVFDQMARIEQLLRPMDTPEQRHRVVLTVHDEVVCVVPEDKAEWALEMMEEQMKRSPSWAKDLPISCEGGVGDSYGDAK